MRYPVESFSEAERALLAPHLPTSTGPYSRSPTCPRRSRARCSRATPAGADAPPALPRRVRRRGSGHGKALRRGRGRACRRAVRTRLHRVRRRLDRPGRRRAPGVRVGLEHPHQGSPARAAGRVSRAVDPLHPVRPAHGVRRRVPLLPDSELGAEYSATMDAIFRDYSVGLETVLAWAEKRWPRGDEPERAWRSSIRAKALDLMRGLLPASTLSHVGTSRRARLTSSCSCASSPRRCRRRGASGR